MGGHLPKIQPNLRLHPLVTFSSGVFRTLCAIARSPLVLLPSAPALALVLQCLVMAENAPAPSDLSPRAPSVPSRPPSMPHVGQNPHVMSHNSLSHQTTPQPQLHSAHHSTTSAVGILWSLDYEVRLATDPQHPRAVVAEACDVEECDPSPHPQQGLCTI